MNKVFAKSTINQETFTFGVIVPVFISFIYMLFPFIKENFLVFMTGTVISTTVVISITSYLRYLISKPLILIEKKSGPVSDKETESGKKSARNLVLYDFVVIIIRWLCIGNLAIFIFGLSVDFPTEFYAINILFLSNGIVSAPIFYLISEGRVDKVLNNAELSKDCTTRVKKFSLIQKISISFSFLIFHLILSFVFIVFLIYRFDYELNVIIGSIGVLFIAEMIFTGVLITLLSNSIRKQLDNFLGMMKSISGGGGDLKRRISDIEDNELGNIALYFNEFIRFLQAMIGNLNNNMSEFTSLANSLSASNTTAYSEITQINSNIIHINDSVIDLNSEILLSGNKTKDVNNFVKNVDIEITKQSEQITDSSTSLNKVIISSESATNNIHNISNIVASLKNSASAGSSEMSKTMEIINKISDSASIIGNSVKVIDDIASRTNLLAMNAAIEASHAGEAGKGFAVVADEIRKLAVSTANNSKEISLSIKEVLTDILESKNRADISDRSFKDIMNQIHLVSNGVVDINKTIESVNFTSKGLVSTFESLSDSGTQLAVSSKQMTSNIYDVNLSFEKINSLSNGTAELIENISDRISKINETLQLVTTTETKNMDTINIIEGLLKKFDV